jgi:hypothetical protein
LSCRISPDVFAVVIDRNIIDKTSYCDYDDSHFLKD